MHPILSGAFPAGVSCNCSGWFLHESHLVKQLLLYFYTWIAKKLLGIDGQFKCLKEENKNEWISSPI